jgi:capsular polysaccharide export protein
MGMIIPMTKTIAALPHLATYLADNPDVVAGWGRKPSGRRAALLARLLGRQMALLEDGFIRSVARHAPPLSLIVDNLGVYYDATRPSRMEHAIAQGAGVEGADRARKLAALWRIHGLSKYNHAPDYPGELPETYVLVVDQTFGDLSVKGGLASADSFAAMLSAALHENPGITVIVKVHPDIFSKGKRGYFDPATLNNPNVLVIAADCHAPSLIAGASAVYCATSLMGFEALLWGRPVRCFGMPFYAGWGLSHDELPPPSRRNHATLEDVVHAALVALARYADPVTGARWEVEQAIDHVARERAAMLTRYTAAV